MSCVLKDDHLMAGHTGSRCLDKSVGVVKSKTFSLWSEIYLLRSSIRAKSEFYVVELNDVLDDVELFPPLRAVIEQVHDAAIWLFCNHRLHGRGSFRSHHRFRHKLLQTIANHVPVEGVCVTRVGPKDGGRKINGGSGRDHSGIIGWLERRSSTCKCS